MSHAHPHDDSILAAFLEPGTIPELAKRLNMSLASLAAWVAKRTDLLDAVHKLLVMRCKLIAAHLELGALSALATISTSATTVDDPKLRERALERQRKAANAILRHRTSLERSPRASVATSAPTRARSTGVPPVPISSTSHAPSNGEARMPNAASALSPLDALMPPASMPSSSRHTQPPKLPLAQRLAARRLSALAAS